jgi:hypothetical protein
MGQESYQEAYREFLLQSPLFQEALRQRIQETVAENLIKSWATGWMEGQVKLTIKILRCHFSDYSDALLELTKRLGRIQDITVLEKIEQAALVSDVQGVWSLVRANDPAR